MLKHSYENSIIGVGRGSGDSFASQHWARRRCGGRDRARLGWGAHGRHGGAPPLLGPALPVPSPHSVAEVDTWRARGTLVVDASPARALRAGHIPKRLADSADGNVSGWVGRLVGPKRPLVPVADVSGDMDATGADQVSEAARQLARAGYHQLVVVNGWEAWTALDHERP